MIDCYDGRYEGNEQDLDNNSGQDDYYLSKSEFQHSHDHERESSKSSEKGRDSKRGKERDRDSRRDRDRDRDRIRERDRGRDNERDGDRSRDKERDRDHRDRDREGDRDRDRYRDRSERRERGRDRDDDYHHSRSQNYDRSRDDDRDREDRHSRRSRSPSRIRSEHRSRSRSRSKSKRISGFDMAPPTSAMLASVAGAAGVANLAVQGGTTLHEITLSVATFFSHVMTTIGGNTAGPGESVVNVYINHEKKFAFVEMRSVEEASNAMALDGIIFEGGPVKVRRPTDYNPSLAATLGPSLPNPNLNLAAVGLIPGSAAGLEGPDRIFVGGVPYYFTESQIRELLESFGPIRGFDLVKDRDTGNSKGYAFCVYQDPAVTDIACAALNGIKMGDKTLTVRRANQGVVQLKPEQENILLHAQQQIALQKLILQPLVMPPTKVLCLTQAVDPNELKEDEDYEDIVEDMKTGCENFGTLVNVVIPRPSPSGEPVPGLGKVFLEYADVDGASNARQGLHGRKFDGNPVVAVFYPEDKFSQGEYDASV